MGARSAHKHKIGLLGDFLPVRHEMLEVDPA